MKLWQSLPAGLLALALALGADPAQALHGKVVGTGFDASLFVTAPKGDRRLFVVEKGGVIRVVRGDKVSTFLDLSDRVDTGGERGLLGLAFDPDFATNGRFYVDYTSATATHVERYTVSPPDADRADRGSRQPIITVDQPVYSNHKGGWIGFRPGDKKNLYVALGDGGSGYDPHDYAQNGQVLLGKMLRINVSRDKGGYRVPADNPFVGSEEVRPEVWALGLRNPFRASFDRDTGDLWIGDVGQDTREEIDFEPAADPGGHNYGWRLREGKVRTPGGGGGDKPGLTDPVFDYPHSGQQGSLGDCVTGGYVYRGPSIPEADGRYFFGDCVSDRAFSFSYNAAGIPVDLREETSALLSGSGLSILGSFGEDGRGRLYLVGVSGSIVVMCPGSAPAPGAEPPASARGDRRIHASVADPCAAP
ncbi:MAG: PQQ-dependent sugar dehydrogenase [Pseudomonadota bacterium]